MVDCECRRGPALCERCVDDGFAQLKGVAACRGERWAAELARMRKLPTLDWARRRIADVALDPGLRDRLAAELMRWAWKTLDRRAA